MRELTTIPLELLRITMGSKELYPTEEKLNDMGKTKLTLTMKLRLRGGVRDT